MRRFALKWIEPALSLLFVVNVFGWTISVGAAFGHTNPVGVVFGLGIGFLLGMATSVLVTGAMFLLISIESRLAALQGETSPVDETHESSWPPEGPYNPGPDAGEEAPEGAPAG